MKQYIRWISADEIEELNEDGWCIRQVIEAKPSPTLGEPTKYCVLLEEFPDFKLDEDSSVCAASIEQKIDQKGEDKMKYIRTKDGRIAEIDIESMLPDDKPYKGEGIGQYCGVPIVAQSDNLEDLCDLIVAVKDRSDLIFWETSKYDIEELDFAVKQFKSFGYQIYAANLTDKGIIYVAKWSGKEWKLL